VTSTINVACAQWRTYYSARVGLIDRTSGRLFSTSSFQIGWQPDVVATISNAATAPQTVGEWQLQLNLYIFEEGGMVGSPFKDAFNVNVVETNSTTQQQVAGISSVAIPGPPASTVTSIMAQSKVAVLTTDHGSTETSYIAIVLASASLLGLIVLALTRKPDE